VLGEGRGWNGWMHLAELARRPKPTWLLGMCLGIAVWAGAAESPAPTPTTGPLPFPLVDLYRRPVGPLGLEYSAAAQAATGRVVRCEGYMVRQAAPVPYCILLSPVPLTLHEKEYGLAEDLPASAIHVFLQRSSQPLILPRRGRIEVEGVLELGPREEADGRISSARLTSARILPATNALSANLTLTEPGQPGQPSAEANVGTNAASIHVPTTPKP
jgi:hypothetical protein